MSYTDYFENVMLKIEHGIATDPIPSSRWIALSTTTPTDAGGNVTEPVGNGYARQQVANNGTFWSVVGSAATNTAEVNFGAPSPAIWGTLTHAVEYDTATSGNPLRWSALGQAIVTQLGSDVKVPIGDITHILD